MVFNRIIADWGLNLRSNVFDEMLLKAFETEKPPMAEYRMAELLRLFFTDNKHFCLCFSTHLA